MSRDEGTDFEELTAAWLTGTLDDAGCHRWQDLLLADPELRRRFLQACHADMLVHEHFLGQRELTGVSTVDLDPDRRDRSVSRVGSRGDRWCRPRRVSGTRRRASGTRRRRMVPAAPVLALVLGALSVLGMLLMATLARVAEPPPSPGTTATLVVGDPVPAGTGRWLSWPHGGSRLWLEPGSRAWLERIDRLRLEHGAVRVAAPGLGPGESLVVRTPLAEARVVGTRFRVHHAEETSSVAVREGVVAVTRIEDGRRHRLGAGERIDITAAGEADRKDRYRLHLVETASRSRQASVAPGGTLHIAEASSISLELTGPPRLRGISTTIDGRPTGFGTEVNDGRHVENEAPFIIPGNLDDRLSHFALPPGRHQLAIQAWADQEGTQPLERLEFTLEVEP